MIDTYLSANAFNALALYCASFCSVIGPIPGHAAVTKQSLESGEIVTVSEAIGDPLQFYACVRSASEITPPEGVEICAATIGSNVVGVWA